ncbi:DUF4136 domain-containing protein [Roseivirga pacifica]|uniref:DUF4136 domain-containing protein n=1 Tax=Roseivirga pacifica TaxID=1267423 RepID=UPI0020941530|nr:DUF4136 domain-containing protein [Roseivirga pacifica]MCO6358680.1 DUF4136 domain-containing protein [Roseivirga pacifica]MCO6365684.1 DUF4136 domain-containing protein [Roseivirga pacifica]MCO6371586.1 DUF4136 domain-containing protein [Roseivirga pacifica]MCO6376303.1 DUF4136 domain-containing protein [Roseivirga pacifica]MCO6378964.1 DUF4136 domain-containing protein [Roseivirga pacifica]
MKNLRKLFGLVLLLAFLSAPAYSQIKSDYSKDADFTGIESYMFAGWQDNSDEILNDIDKKRILDAFKAEMDARGLEHKTSGADVVLTLFVVVDSKTSTTAYTDFNSTMGYRGRWGWGYGYGGVGTVSATTTYSENDYLEGTLVVDMYDADGKDLMWQGIIKKVVKSNPKKREKTIPKNINKLMKKFPIEEN